MKTCPICNRSFTDEALNFCLQDGSPLVITRDPETTVTSPGTYQTNPGVVRSPASHQPPPFQPRYTPMPDARQGRSSAVWWILGALAAIVVLGIGGFIVFLAVLSMSSHPNNNNRVVVVNDNRNTNTNSRGKLPARFSDDFSTPKWGTSNSAFGDIWYKDDEYHMKSKDKTFVVMYAPSEDYGTENATVRVTARNVDGISPSAGYGLVVHGARKDEKLEDYAFLIRSTKSPQYQVALHKAGAQTQLVPWTASSLIRSGTSTNQIEVRIKGSQLSFYINGQYATSITDTANYKRGRAGFYTSDAHEVAFDDLEINR